jgi:mxaK protein
MRRSVAHWTFGAIALACAAFAVDQGLRLHASERVNEAIANARISDFDASIPQARFARAVALARAGESDVAIKAYKSLSGEHQGELRRRALYNLGNLYMRNALANVADTAQSLPLVELAKQSYRELLRLTPADWDARYNLELALRLAPEVEAEMEEEKELPKREQSTSTLQGARIDLP